MKKEGVQCEKAADSLCLPTRYAPTLVVFIDYNSINGIVKSTNLNIISIDCINRYFINVSIYLSIYPLDVYYILSCLNLVLNVFSRLRTIEDDIVRADNEVEPALDTI